MQERIYAHAERRGFVDLAGHRLAHRHAAQRIVELREFGARQIDAKQRARKSVGAGRQLDGDEGTAGIRGGVDFYSELIEHAADAVCGDFVTIVHRAQRQRLPPIDTIERSFHAVECRADARLSAAIVS